ncbi:MAG: helix-turn-helix transcriptional regulator [Oscillospiraceae bacterium]|nr:helix-turn-helix transcriptional regulator [Oscillospiraceae bacterium]
MHVLAEKSGVHYMKIHQIEAGKLKAENIALRNGLKLADALGCHPRDLLEKWPLDEKAE